MPIESRKQYRDRYKVARVELAWPHAEPLNPDADIADVVVHMEDGARWQGTVTTLQFIRDTMERAAEEKGNVEADYWFGDAIIMSRIDEDKLSTIVDDLIDSRVFEKAFRKADVAAVR